jgi:hypothetical protein
MSDPGYFSKVAVKIRNIDKQNRMWFVMRKMTFMSKAWLSLVNGG